MNPAKHSATADKAAATITFWVCMTAWLLSFFLPAFRGDGFWVKSGNGFDAFITSIFLILVPVYGWVWLPNIFVAVAPFYARRIERNKSSTGYVVGLCLCSIFPLAVPTAISLGYSPGALFRLEAAYYLWQISLLATATWFLWSAYRTRSVLVAWGLVTGLLLSGSFVVAPAYSLHKHVREARINLQAAAREADRQIQAFENGGRPELIAIPKVRDSQYLNPKDGALKDFQLAMGYMDDIYTCHDQERISDYFTLERYPGVPAHSPDPAHKPQPLGTAHRHDPACLIDASDKEPWMYYRDIQPAALAKAKLYLRDAEIEMGMVRGQKRLPGLLSAFELGFPNRLPTKDLTAHVRKLEGVAEIINGADIRARVIPTRVDADSLLPKGGYLRTGTYSKAEIFFSDGVTCTVGSTAFIAVAENTINSAGRINVKVLLKDGKIVMETPSIGWGSKVQVDLGSSVFTVTLGSESLVELEGSSGNAAYEALVKKGSAEASVEGEEPIKLSAHERASYPGTGGRVIKTKESVTSPLQAALGR